MDRKKREKIEYSIIVLLGITIAVLIAFIVKSSNLNIDETYKPDLTVIDNPLMGLAPDAADTKMCANSKLVYITLTWAEWEPKEGEFAIEALEKKYHIVKWKEENKHGILRFVCDIPGIGWHKDIPMWLSQKLDSGTYYHNSYGAGFSPDYSDDEFFAYHKKALDALAQYCNKDNFFAFVELGSLGHDGNWEAEDNTGESLMPSPTMCFEYANAYSDAFSTPVLLAPRNYYFVTDGELGLYNNYLGDAEYTNKWLEDITDDGEVETSEGSISLTPVEKHGKMHPVGGCIFQKKNADDLIRDELGDMLSSVTFSNMTYIGKNVPDPTSEENLAAIESLVRRMGYRIYPSKLKTRYDFSSHVLSAEVSFANAGSAGFFFDWPVTLYVYNKDRELVFWEGLELDLTDLNEADEVTALSGIPLTEDLREEFYIGIGITDYDGKDNVKLAIEYEDETADRIGDVELIYHYFRSNE